MKKNNSAGILFLHLAGKVIDDKIYIEQVNTYKDGLNFVKASNDLYYQNNSDINLYCILGLKEKVECFSNIIENQIKDNYNRIFEDKKLLEKCDKLDVFGNNFYNLIHEYTFLEDAVKFLRKNKINGGAWAMHSFWIGDSPDDKGYLLTDNVLDIWLDLEKPIIMGKQIMIQSVLLSDLRTRKIIGAFPNMETGEWTLILEGGFKLNLNAEIPYMRERVGVRDFDIFTISDVDEVINNPIYGYGKWYNPTEIYEEWHKVFLYASALQDCEWTIESLTKTYEKFLNFISENICDIMDASPMITKEEYHEILFKNVEMLKEFIKGNEEAVISKEVWMLLNSRYVYLPYIYNIMKIPSIENEVKFSYEELQNKLKLSESKNRYEKGIKFEEVAEYFIKNIPGLRVSGTRVKTGEQEIDLSAINISLDNNLWEMGAYILIECKNWKKKVDIQVIRGLSHISDLKGNKTTILFSANDITKDAEKEIIRTAINGRFILNITKKELSKIKTKEDCYKLLITKWNNLQEQIKDKLNI